MSVFVYKCPQCSAGLAFNAETQRWDCPYCMGSFDLDELKKIEAKKKVNEEAHQEAHHSTHTHEHATHTVHEEGHDHADYDNQIRVYSCPDCGAEIVTDATTAATFCVFCSNPTIIPSQLSGKFRPSKVIPFKFDKDSAKKAFMKWCGKKPLVPKDFKSTPQMEKITGVYLPFWLFDCDVSGTLDANATRVRSWRTGDTQYTETQHYKLFRDGQMAFKKVPADGSSKLDDKMMDLLEPYHYDALVDFSMSYLSGYLAEKYDLDQKAVLPRIQKRVNEDTMTQLKATTAGYSTVRIENSHVSIDHWDAAYALMPVWMLVYKYNGKSYLFAMNGQTGKVVGKLPLSLARAAAWFAGLAAAIFGVLFVGGMIL